MVESGEVLTGGGCQGEEGAGGVTRGEEVKGVTEQEVNLVFNRDGRGTGGGRVR